MAFELYEVISDTVTIASGGTSNTVNITGKDSSNTLPLENTFVVIEAMSTSTGIYSPQYFYTTAQLLDDGSGNTYQIKFERGNPTGGYGIDITYRVVYSNANVFHASGSFSGSDTAYMYSGNTPSNSFPILTVNSSGSGQGFWFFLVKAKIGVDSDGNYYELTAIDNSKTLNYVLQVVGHPDFNVTQVEFNSSGLTSAETSAMGTGQTKDNTFIALSYQANSTTNWNGVASYKYCYINSSDEVVLSDYKIDNGNASPDVSAIVYCVEVTSENVTIKNTDYTLYSSLDPFLGQYTDETKTFHIDGNQYNYLCSSNQLYEEDNDTSLINVSYAPANNGVDITRANSDHNAKGHISFIEVSDATQEIFNYLHYVGRGVRVGVGVGVC